MTALNSLMLFKKYITDKNQKVKNYDFKNSILDLFRK